MYQINNLGWNANGFDRFSLVSCATPGDGSCFFHAICGAFFIPYRTETLNGQKVSKREIVVNLRRELADSLDQVYDTIGNGNIKELGKDDADYSLQGLKAWLNSDRSVGIEMVDYISLALKRNIFILDASRRDLYRTASDNFHPEWSCVVLLYHPGHYELAALQNSSGSYDSHFTSDNSFIRFLLSR